MFNSIEKKILFIGDSITDCGRRQGQGKLGNGYVRLIADMISIREPEIRCKVINKGIDGNVICHLLSRWCDDVLELKPDYLFILIGINDAMRYLDRSNSLHSNPSQFYQVYDVLISETRNKLPKCQIFLMQPFFISRGDHLENSWRNALIKLLNDYQKSIQRLSCQHQLTLIDLQEKFSSLVSHQNSDIYSEDKIHPESAGHLAIAEAVFQDLKKFLIHERKNR